MYVTFYTQSPMANPFDDDTLRMRSLLLTAHRAFTEKISKHCEALERQTSALADISVPLTVQMENVQKTTYQRKTQGELARARNVFGFISEVPLTGFGAYLHEKRKAIAQAHQDALLELNEAALRLVNSPSEGPGRDRAVQGIVNQAGVVEAHRFMLEQFDTHFASVVKALTE